MIDEFSHLPPERRAAILDAQLAELQADRFVEDMNRRRARAILDEIAEDLPEAMRAAYETQASEAELSIRVSDVAIQVTATERDQI